MFLQQRGAISSWLAARAEPVQLYGEKIIHLAKQVGAGKQ